MLFAFKSLPYIMPLDWHTKQASQGNLLRKMQRNVENARVDVAII